MRIQLGHTIGAAGIERRAFNLGNGLHHAKHLRGAGLVKTYLGVDQANGFKQIEAANAGDLRGGGRLIKRHAHKALSGQVVYFGGLHLLHHGDARAQVGQVVFDQIQIRAVLDAQLFDSPEVDRTGAAVGAVHGVALVEQELRQIGTILTGNTCNYSNHLNFTIFNTKGKEKRKFFKERTFPPIGVDNKKR